MVASARVPTLKLPPPVKSFNWPMSALAQKRTLHTGQTATGVDESRLALHGASSGGAAMIALKSHHICGEIGGGGLDYPRRRLARRPPSAIGLGPLEEHD